ncbi:Hypothetical protein R9X50_00690300 [Acrodontium crateriforme]|uniref:Helicase ATP-binding domain-containing protein n=1 Tax=Acrodontium crateriforme TaxID=150365 RepID=A0AAQ3RAC4_9PEZI|nr:Hypothetical protein R9X50_00690300 [Acrodontium crateriforme]
MSQTLPSRQRSPTSSSSGWGGSLTPATSRSSSGRSPLAKTIVKEHSAEAELFLSKIENYLPLGCLNFQSIDDTCEGDSASRWEETTSPPSALSIDTELYAALTSLQQAKRIRISTKRCQLYLNRVIARVHILPADVGLRFVGPLNKKLVQALGWLLTAIDISPVSWSGEYRPPDVQKFDMWATADDSSLFYMFNKIPSPAPSANSIKEIYTREALEDILDSAALPGLKSTLYPYQRRSAGLMLQREAVPKLQLDPRLEPRTAPDGTRFYYGARGLVFCREPKYYETCRGGILAETMGLGKTVILLALILSTKSHQPRFPSPYDLPNIRTKVGTLSDMVVSAIHKKSIPYHVEFDRIKHAHGFDMANCTQKLESAPPHYSLAQTTVRWNRNTVTPPPKKMLMASTTIVVVPRNLCKQWQSEITKHVDTGALRVLVMEDNKKKLPEPDALRTYDVILFSRSRLEMEIKDGSDEQGRRLAQTRLLCRCPYIGATRTRDCTCVRTDQLYDSPLKHVHFKRLIIDEGHGFSNGASVAVIVTNKLITADHRWIVSGTPAKDLLGVEVDMTASTEVKARHEIDMKENRHDMLEKRRYFNRKEDTSGAIKSLGSFASSFFKIEPWSSSNMSNVKAEWDEHVYRHEDFRKRTFSAFSSCLQRTLEAMVVKTRPEDVERDIELPPLTHEIVRLEPCLFDKVTANLFNLVLTANAVTSERTDRDYLFHPANQKPRAQLLSTNLRQSAFFWTGFSEADVVATIETCNGYLEKKGASCSDEDRQLLNHVTKHAETILASKAWKSMSNSHELGLIINDWPSDSAEHWAFDENNDPLLTGLSQLLEAQKYVNERAALPDPADGLSGLGIRATASARMEASNDMSNISKGEKLPLTSAGIPISSLSGEPSLKRRASINVKPSSSSHTTIPVATPDGNNSTEVKSTIQAKKKRRRSAEIVTIPDLPNSSPLLQSRIVGTTSAKLSYLISSILKYSATEKIIVFYEGDNIAFYIAQMLELLHIRHEIYANRLANRLKSEYVVRFDQELEDRVLLMDVKQAAFGLNLSSASRIYFVNPICRPSVEAQAIKRAHRIGQTRRVFVETLVLKGTIEEKIFERSRRMTRAEHNQAKQFEDDGDVRAIIQNAKPLKIEECEMNGYGRMARLEHPQQFWGRSGWREALGVKAPGCCDATDGFEVDLRPLKKSRVQSVDGMITDIAEREGIDRGNEDTGLPKQTRRSEESETPRLTFDLGHGQVAGPAAGCVAPEFVEKDN